MTARELINALLDFNMDERVILYLPEPDIDDNGEMFEGYVFDIERAQNNEIVFLDWRKPEKKTLNNKLYKIKQIVDDYDTNCGLEEHMYLEQIKEILGGNKDDRERDGNTEPL